MIDSITLQNCKQDFDSKLSTYSKMQNYYDSKTDAKANYKMITSRSNLFVDTNFIQKFVQQESNYCCLQKITYSSYSNNLEIIDAIRTSFKNYSEGYNKELLKQALIFQEAYEIHYISSSGDFDSLICTPLDSYILQDDFGNIELFIRFFKKKFDTYKTLYADVYASDGSIAHYTVQGNSFTQIGNIDTNIFSRVPVGICKIGTISESLYCKLKGLQDSFTTNLSDQANLNSDLRTKYLHFKNCEPTPEQMSEMKQNATITTSGDGDVKWLQSNEVSFKDTLDKLEDSIYQQASHLDWNTPLSSNVSSIAIQGTLIGLNNKVGDDISAITDCIKTRLQFLFEYLRIKNGLLYDWKDIDIKITPNVPSDNMQAAQIVSQTKGILPIKEGLKLFSFVDNPSAVYQELMEENKANSIGADLLNGGN